MRVYAQHLGRIGLRSAIVVACIFLSTVVLGTFFFLYNQHLTAEQLKSQMTSLASVAALQFNSVDVERVHSVDDITSPSFNRLVTQLHDITQELPDVRFAYLMRRTNDPMKLTFIADSELFLSTEAIDTNNDGHLDSEETPSLPGTEYDVSDVPKLQSEAFVHPTTDDFFTGDQWGTFLSAYAPVKDSYGNTIAVLGLDMDAVKFQQLSQSFFRPVVFLLVMILGLAITALVGVSMWKRQVESVLKLEEDRTALINLAMHQLGAPLAIVRWWLEILCESNECKKPNACHHCEICDEMKEGVARLVEVMAALKEVSEIDSKRALISGDPGYLSDCIASITHDFQSRLTAQGKKLVVEDKATRKPLSIDKNLITGILRELVSNALDYSPSGATITVHTRDTVRGVQFDVSDNGYGIPRKDLANLFQKFSRGSNATKYKTVGNGIGLYVVRNIVDKAGGRIGIESELGKGTTVTVTLPRMRL